MQVNLGIWEKLTKLVVFLLFVSGACAVCIWYLPLIRQNERMRQHLYQLDLRIAQEKERARAEHAAIEALKNDPKTVERLARASLGYAKPGETIIRFEPPGR